jgi:[glutamine synthetase] adenylyltransferase / [glutamine synthetase]-adenylyl-L-tyrosine phosphorylase
MMVNKKSEDINTALEQAWNINSAKANLDRWISVCKKENWEIPDNKLPLLIKLFGASWYFTRFVFFRGIDVLNNYNFSSNDTFTREQFYDRLVLLDGCNNMEEKFDQLRCNKNEVMLQIFLNGITNKWNQEQQEQALTNLAEATLQIILDILFAGEKYKVTEISILAMGRMAGKEMNFGSDLDLIFLFSREQVSDRAGLSKQIQMLLRHIAVTTPFGILYEIDMRLRPHGTSGTLISAADYFVEYHSSQREIWERQMMTRCRPIIDYSNLAENSLGIIKPFIYAEYDESYICTEILQMRKKVENELGNPKGKFEIKRGLGGIMDIDFITHYLQLMYGNQNKQLQTSSTRNALKKLGHLNILSNKQMTELLEAYDYLKHIEAILRIMDLKNISAFSRDPHDIHVLSRAMGYINENMNIAADEFLHGYTLTTQKVRNHFNGILDVLADI